MSKNTFRTKDSSGNKYKLITLDLGELSDDSDSSPRYEEMDLEVAGWEKPPPFDESLTVDIRLDDAPRNKYSNGKIYKIFDKNDDKQFYIGSTCDPILTRFEEHKRHSKIYTMRKLYAYFNNINVGWDRACIILLQNFKCSTLTELLQREGLFIRKYRAPLNSQKMTFMNDEQKKNYSKSYNDLGKRKDLRRVAVNPRRRKFYPKVVYEPAKEITTIDEARAEVFALNDLLFKSIMSSK